MIRSKIVAVGSLAALMVLVTASPAPAKPLSEKQWRKQAGAICAQLGSELAAIGAVVYEDSAAHTPEELTALVEQAIPVYEEAITATDALNEPKSLKKGVKKFVTVATEELAALQADPSLLTDDPLPNSHKISSKLGIKCNSG